MRRLIRTLAPALAAGLALTAAAAPGAAAPPDHAAAPSPVERTVAAMQPGWNLGNSLDAVGEDETAWGNPAVTRELIEGVAGQGFNSIRIPVTWGQHQGGAPDYAIEPAFLDRVEEVVDWALDADLYVLLDVHHDSWMWINDAPDRPEEVTAQFRALWEQVAERFADHPETLLFESINEPQFAGVDEAGAYAALHELNVVFHEVVRGSGGNNTDRVLVLPTLHTNDEQPRMDALLESFAALDDPNLVATVHYYGYWPFSVNVAGGTRFDDVARAHMADAFARMHDNLVSRGIPVILGEYGLLGFDRHTGTIEQGEKLKFFEELGYAARAAGVTTMLWDNGQHLDRTELTWQDPALFAHVATSWKTRSGTASTDQVFVDADGVEPQALTLEPHGHRFTGLYRDGERLEPGADYRLEGDTLTLAAGLLAQLVPDDGTYGVRSVLEVRFSRGVPWRIEVISAGTPVLGDATGTTDDFAIPTTFRGDRLATMEARYVDDGSNAGPHPWTSFKEFDWTFAPDSDAEEIVLRPELFAEVDDRRPVRLTFHFWSGVTIDYTVVRDGTEVSGTA